MANLVDSNSPIPLRQSTAPQLLLTPNWKRVHSEPVKAEYKEKSQFLLLVTLDKPSEKGNLTQILLRRISLQ